MLRFKTIILCATRPMMLLGAAERLSVYICTLLTTANTMKALK